MPFEGQDKPQQATTLTEEVKAVVREAEAVIEIKEEVLEGVKEEVKELVVRGASNDKPERKTIAQPTGNLMSTNIGIKATLAPPKKNLTDEEEVVQEQMTETYSMDQFDHAWKEYALGVKREKRDSLHSTLVSSEMNIDSSNVITLKIKNSVQAAELDLEKGELVRFLRSKLKNSSINLAYTLDEQAAIVQHDSKSKFDKMAEENSSLHKFRKLFNLDIEY